MPMRRFLAAASVLILLGACTSGDSGCGGGEKKESAGESSSMPGGGGTGGGALGEPVSFQGMARKQEPPAPQQGAAQAAAPAAAGAAGAAPASGGADPAPGGSGSQTVICGGFPDLPADCSKAPAFDAIKKKCCPSGQVEACQGIPGGARLTGKGCTAAAR